MPINNPSAKQVLTKRPKHPPYLQGDDRGGNVAHQNIHVTNCETGESFSCHMAEPANPDPYAMVQIKGMYLDRVEKERKKIQSMSGAFSNSPNT
jgi:hypothetical protein